MKVEQNDGSTCDLTFNVKVAPEVAHQLLSHTMLIQECWEITAVKRNNPIKSTIELQCNSKRFKVDQIIKSGESALFGVKVN